MHDMSHYYYFAFVESPDGQGERRTSACIGLTYPKISKKVMESAREIAGAAASPHSVMTCCTYLGEMTKEEFNDA
jgi:hypothetical protein